MIVLGLVLLVIGWLAGIPILVTIGTIVLVIGLVLMVLGTTGRAIGGRRYWY
jgi:Family of unknown function (DUF6131)